MKSYPPVSKKRILNVFLCAILVLSATYLVLEILLMQQLPATFVAFCSLSSEKKSAFMSIRHFDALICLHSMVSVPEYLSRSKQFFWGVSINESSSPRSLLTIQESLHVIAPTSLTLNKLGVDLTDHELKTIKGIVSIDTLRLQGTAISDESVPILLSLPKLCYLDVRETRITENGLSQIVQSFEPKKYLMIIAFDCEVSPEFYENYKKINPRITIQCKIKNESESDNAESLENPP